MLQIRKGMGRGSTLGQTFLVSFLEHPRVKGSCTDTRLGHVDGRPYSMCLQEELLLIPILQSKKPKPERMRDTPRLDCSLMVVITESPPGAEHFLFCNVILRAPL